VGCGGAVWIGFVFSGEEERWWTEAIVRHRVRWVLWLRHWVRLFKLLHTGLGGVGEMESKFAGEACMRESWQGLARRDAERQRRGEMRRAGC